MAEGGDSRGPLTPLGFLPDATVVAEATWWQAFLTDMEPRLGQRGGHFI
jgi:hypothetical protein